MNKMGWKETYGIRICLGCCGPLFWIRVKQVLDEGFRCMREVPIVSQLVVRFHWQRQRDLG